MEGFLDALYEYAQEQGIAPHLENREYRRAIHDLEADWTAFRSTLTEKQGQSLELLLVREKKSNIWKRKPSFSAACP